MRAHRLRRGKEDRAADLLSAARDLFVEKGFAAARLDDVAAKAGVSKGTTYLYFESKEALFRAVVESGLAPVTEVVAELKSLANETDRPAIDRLSEYFDAWRPIAGEAAIGSSLKLLIAESGNFPDLTSRFEQAIVSAARAALLRIVDAGVASGDFRRVQADMIVNLFVAAIWLSAVGPCSIPSSSREGPLGVAFDVLTQGLCFKP